MTFKSISNNDLSASPFGIWNDQWFLLCAGDYASGEYNAMTVSWGSIGCVWGKPLAQIFVRPTRYTYQFTEKFDSFTLSSFSPDYKKALNLLGTRSGRDGNKIKDSGLTPIASQSISAPGFAEAAMILECRKMFWHDIEPDHILNQEVDEKIYQGNNYHRIYYGEITQILISQP